MFAVSFAPELLPHCRVIAGPTASGKSALALHLAERWNAEIVGLDSMTLYRGMDVGTAKPTPAERAAAPHHLFDLLDPHEEFSVAEYLAAAERAVREILARGKTPLFVGGAGLYLRSLLRGVFEGPPADWSYRRELEAAAETEGADSLHRKLQSVDVATAARLHPRDVRRIIRALEVHRATGRPLSEQQLQSPREANLRPGRVVWLSLDRATLHARINERTREMFDAGWIAEVERLLAAPIPWSRTAGQAIGYADIAAWLGAGRPEPVSALIETVQQRTRQFAKRQETWFRNLEECTPLVVDGRRSLDELADAVDMADSQ